MENISNWLGQWITAYIPETKDVESANNPNSAISWQNFNAFKMSHSQVAKRNHGRNGIRKIPTQVVYGKISALCKNRTNTLLNNKIKQLEEIRNNWHDGTLQACKIRWQLIWEWIMNVVVT